MAEQIPIPKKYLTLCFRKHNMIMSSAGPNQYYSWKAAGALRVVQMGEVVFHTWNVKEAVGTDGLGGCFAVMIASIHAAIMAHIPPRPNGSVDPRAGLTNVENMMDRVCSTYEERRNYFPSHETVVSLAMYGGSVGLQDHLDIINRKLRQRLGIVAKLISYDTPTGIDGGDGTAMIIMKRVYAKPNIFVGSRHVNP